MDADQSRLIPLVGLSIFYVKQKEIMEAKTAEEVMSLIKERILIDCEELLEVHCIRALSYLSGSGYAHLIAIVCSFSLGGIF